MSHVASSQMPASELRAQADRAREVSRCVAPPSAEVMILYAIDLEQEARELEQEAHEPEREDRRGMTKEDVLAWVKQRAHEYLDRGEVPYAMASLIADLNQHPECVVPDVFVPAVQAAASKDLCSARQLLDGLSLKR